MPRANIDNRPRLIRSAIINAHKDSARELQDEIQEFSRRAGPEEVQTLLRILKCWPAIRATTKDALFAAVVAEYRAV